MKLEIKEELFDQMIASIEGKSPLEVKEVSVLIGEYKGYKIRLALQKPEE